MRSDGLDWFTRITASAPVTGGMTNEIRLHSEQNEKLRHMILQHLSHGYRETKVYS